MSDTTHARDTDPTPAAADPAHDAAEPLADAPKATVKAKAAAKAAAKGKAPKREKDTRRILSGVQLPEPSGSVGGVVVRTYVQEADRDDRDALEDAMTPQDVEYLKSAGAIEGDWKPGQDSRPPMAGSRADTGPSEMDALRAEIEALKAAVHGNKKG